MLRPPKSPKPLKASPFTEAQIRERAYALLQAHPEESAAVHWEEAIKALRRERSLVWQLRQSWQTAFSTENRSFSLDAIKTWISALGLLATVTAGVGLYLNYQQGQEKLVTDRFAKAVEQLGNGTIDVRIGAIYSLERIAKDSPKDHWTIMEVLTAFVRNRSPLPKDGNLDSKQVLPSITTDVQSALTVIGRRDVANDPNKEFKLKSGSVYMGRWETNLSHTNLKGASLVGADLSLSNLSGANLINADLSEANLDSAILSHADLSGAGLSTTNLFLTNLSGASLNRAILRGADLSHIMGLTPTQIKQADNWQHAHYNPAFRKALGLPPEKP